MQGVIFYYKVWLPSREIQSDLHIMYAKRAYILGNLVVKELSRALYFIQNFERINHEMFTDRGQ